MSAPVTGDGHNAFEHALRQHVGECVDAFNTLVSDRDGNTTHLYIMYDNDKPGGKWVVRSYAPDIVTVGAELMLVMLAHGQSFLAQRGISTLRGKLSYDPA